MHLSGVKLTRELWRCQCTRCSRGAAQNCDLCQEQYFSCSLQCRVGSAGGQCGAPTGESAGQPAAARPVERLLALADDTFVPARVAEGLSSGEGLIWQVRDPIARYERTGRGAEKRTELVEVDPGVEDKRLWVVESEFASALRVIQREISDPLALAILEGRYGDGSVVKVDIADDDLVLK